MKPYKTKEMNDKVREAVRTAREYCDSHPDCSRRYLSNEEFSLDMCHICNVPLSIGKRVPWFLRSDGARDEKAMALWGFNQYTA